MNTCRAATAAQLGTISSYWFQFCGSLVSPLNPPSTPIEHRLAAACAAGWTLVQVKYSNPLLSLF